MIYSSCQIVIFTKFSKLFHSFTKILGIPSSLATATNIEYVVLKAEVINLY